MPADTEGFFSETELPLVKIKHKEALRKCMPLDFRNMLTTFKCQGPAVT